MREQIEKPRFPWWLSATVAVVVAAIVMAGVWLALSGNSHDREDIQDDLLAIGQLKAGQIAGWRGERLGDAGVIAESRFAADLVGRWLASESADDESQLLDWFGTLQQQYGYANVRVVDPDGAVLLSLGDAEPLAPAALEALQVALSERKAVLTDLHRDLDGAAIDMDGIAPLFDSTASGGQPLAAIVLEVDANDFLFPLVQSWPTASESAETLLVERRGGFIIYLNELRHQTGTALELETPLTQASRPAVLAVLGVQGIVEGDDYRGVNVLAALQAIPDSPWFIVAKIDTAEAFAGANTRMILVVVVVALLLAAIGGTTAVLWQRVLKRRYQQAYDAEVSRKVLSERYAHLVQQANDVILLSDEQGHFVEVNERALETYGYSREEMLGLHVSDLVPPEGLPAFEERLLALREKGSYILEATHRRKDGSAFPVEISARTIASEGDLYQQGIIRDLSERNRAEAMRRLLQYSIDNAADSIFWTDAEGRLVYVSESTCRRHGYSRTELLKKTIFDIDPTIPREQWDARWQILKNGGTLQTESIHNTKAGESFPVEVRGNYVEFDGQGYTCVFARDITERKRAEETLRDRDEQLRQSQKMEAIGQLAGGIAHDFNNLLTAILGYGDLLLAGDDLVGPSAREDMEQIKRAAERAAGLTRQILAFSRRQALRPKVVSLNEILANVEPLLRRTLGEDIDLVSVPAPDLSHVEVDVHQFEQVLMNLALNARDAMPNGGRLTLETANAELDEHYCRTHPEVDPGKYVVLAVSDTGLGMEEDTLSRIFEPFFTTKGPGEGTGLGLATVYGTVKQSYGSISVYSEPGKGTCFKIYLPLTTLSVQTQGRVTAETATTRGNETVLLVEDEAALRDLAVRVLTEYGYNVLGAGTAAEALQIMQDVAGEVAILVTDLILPGELQGKELADQLLSSRPDLPVVYMSGYTRNAIVHAGRLDQGVNFLEKPFAPTALVAMIREVLDRTTGRT